MWRWGDSTISNRVFSIDLTEKGTFEQKLEGPGRKHSRKRKWAIQELGEHRSVSPGGIASRG